MGSRHSHTTVAQAKTAASKATVFQMRREERTRYFPASALVITASTDPVVIG